MTKRKYVRRVSYLSFKEARNYVHTLQLKGRTEWKVFCKNGKRPGNIPAVPDLFYSEFISYEDWTGGTKRPIYRQYEEAREFARSLKLKDGSEWVIFAKSKKRPHDIPAYPYHVYKGKFISWKDWLGTNSIHWRYQTWSPFLEARAHVHTLGLKGQIGWKKFCKNGLRPQDIPAAPERHYLEWESWSDWTGYSRK